MRAAFFFVIVAGGSVKPAHTHVKRHKATLLHLPTLLQREMQELAWFRYLRRAPIFLLLAVCTASDPTCADEALVRELQDAVFALNQTVRSLTLQVDACCANGGGGQQSALSDVGGTDFPFPLLYRVVETRGFFSNYRLLRSIQIRDLNENIIGQYQEGSKKLVWDDVQLYKNGRYGGMLRKRFWRMWMGFLPNPLFGTATVEVRDSLGNLMLTGQDESRLMVWLRGVTPGFHFTDALGTKYTVRQKSRTEEATTLMITRTSDGHKVGEIEETTKFPTNTAVWFVTMSSDVLDPRIPGLLAARGYFERHSTLVSMIHRTTCCMHRTHTPYS
jgi:hypothetical protein